MSVIELCSKLLAGRTAEPRMPASKLSEVNNGAAAAAADPAVC